MKRFDIILVLTMFMLSTSVLFQNCSDIKSSKATTPVTTSTIPDDTDDRVVPEFLSNRAIPLDGKTLTGLSVWNFEGTDSFYYETDYIATYESTLVSITNKNSDTYFSVTADDCSGEKVLTYDEKEELNIFYETYIPVTDEKIPAVDELQIMGCAFPRLIVDATGTLNDGSPALDYEIYFASRECTPANNLYVSTHNNNDPALALADVQAFFRTQIDQVCGL